MMHMPSGFEWIIIMGVALLLFGKRLPEVGKSLGKGIVEFKKGLKGIEDEIGGGGDPPVTPVARQPLQTRLPDQPTQPAVPANPGYKFDPYTGKPVDQSTQSTTV